MVERFPRGPQDRIPFGIVALVAGSGIVLFRLLSTFPTPSASFRSDPHGSEIGAIALCLLGFGVWTLLSSLVLRIETSDHGIVEFSRLNRRTRMLAWSEIRSVERVGERRIRTSDYSSYLAPIYLLEGEASEVRFDASLFRFVRFVRIVGGRVPPEIAAELARLVRFSVQGPPTSK